MAGPKQKAPARKAGKKGVAKRAPKPKTPAAAAATPSPEQAVESAAAALAAIAKMSEPPPFPSNDPNFTVQDDGTIAWIMDGEIYRLGFLSMGAWFDLDSRLKNAPTLVAAAQVRASEMPQRTADERDAKIAALARAGALNVKITVEWFEALFRYVELDGKAFPAKWGPEPDNGMPPVLRTPAPAWTLRVHMMSRFLAQLEGPPDPGDG